MQDTQSLLSQCQPWVQYLNGTEDINLHQRLNFKIDIFLTDIIIRCSKVHSSPGHVGGGGLPMSVGVALAVPSEGLGQHFNVFL